MLMLTPCRCAALPVTALSVKGIKYTLTSDEINVDLESIRQQLTGLGGSTRSKAKL